MEKSKQIFVLNFISDFSQYLHRGGSRGMSLVLTRRNDLSNYMMISNNISLKFGVYIFFKALKITINW